MPLTLAEFQIRKRLPNRRTILLFDAACLLGWTTTRAIAELAEVSLRRARLELAALVRNGWLVGDARGAKNQARQVRFRARVGVIQPDHSAVIQPDHSAVIQPDHSAVIQSDHTEARSHLIEHAGARARAPAPPVLDLAKRSQASVRPEGSGEGRTHARTGVHDSPDVRGSDVQYITRTWGVTGAIAHRYVRQLQELGLARSDVREYLDAAKRGEHPAFVGLSQVTYPLAVACSRERLEPWLASRPRPRAPEPTTPVVTAPPAPVMSAAEVEARARRAQQAARGRVARDEADAIGTLVKRELAKGGRVS